MLKSLFESSIDSLNIPLEMKGAIKAINNICLEAEDKNKSKGNRGPSAGSDGHTQTGGKAAASAADNKKQQAQKQQAVNKQYNFDASTN